MIDSTEESGNKNLLQPRLRRELKTVQAMIGLYCRAHHAAGTALCADCQELSGYAERRLAACPFQQKKTTCGSCTVHCYRPAMKARIIAVMKYSGPRMILRHPYLALAHLLDARRCKAALTMKNGGGRDEKT